MTTLPEKVFNNIAERILHTLSIYPKLSPSMLQISLNMPARKWKPVLEELIRQHKINRSVTVSITTTGRNQAYTILELPPVFKGLRAVVSDDNG